MTATFEQRETEALAAKMQRGIAAEQALGTMSGPEAIGYALAMMHGTQADLARASGITGPTITAMKQGKSKPNAAHRAALAWAIAKGY